MKRFWSILLPVLLSVVLFAAVVFWLIIPDTRQAVLANKKAMIRELVNTACAVLDSYYRRERMGELSHELAQEMAKAQLRMMRYGADRKDYFWINDMRPVMIMHPYRQDLEGKNVRDLTDAKGKYLIREIVKVAGSRGAGYVSYYWQWKDDPSRVVPKLSYVKIFKPWKWIVGTGVYLEDIERDMGALTRRISMAALLVLAVSGLLCLYIAWRMWKMEREREEVARKLQSSSATLQAVLKASPLAIVTLDRQGRVTMWSGAAQEIFGWSEDEVLGEFHPIIPQDERPAFLRYLQDVFAGEVTPFYREVVRFRKDGSSLVAGIHGAPMYDKKGRVNSVLGMIADVTERKEAENALRISEERHRAMLQCAPDPIVVYDQQGRAIYINPAFTRVFGWSEDEVLGRKIDFVPPDKMEQTRQAIEILYQSEGGYFAFDTQRLDKEGRLIDVSIRAAVFRDQQGRGVGIVVNLIDITHRKRAEQELLQSEERYRSLVENVPYGLFIAEAESGRFLFANQKLCDLFGYDDPEELGHLTFWGACDPAEHAIIKERLLKRLRGQKVAQPQVYTGVRRDGSHLRFEVSVAVVTYRRQVCLQGVVRDITEFEAMQKQLQEAQKMEALGTLTGGVAHEFNNILMAIRGYSQLLGELPGMEGAAARYLDKIDDATQRAAELADTMLSFARREDSEMNPLLVNDIVAEIRVLMERTLPPSIELVLDLTPDLPPVMANRSQLEQVILNLALNARDAMPQGGRLTLRTGLHPAGKPFPADHVWARTDISYLKIEVCDTGAGMGPKVLERIFDPFFTTKEPGKGTGLGLAVAYSIIKNHGGAIVPQSRQGQGTVFTVYLPVEEGLEIKVERRREKPELPRGQGQRILVVDDEQAVREVSRHALEAFDYRVDEAADGQQALEMFRQARRRGEPYDLVILDLAMPLMDGRQCAALMLAEEPDTPILIVTGHGAAQAGLEELAPRVAGQLRKPFDLSSLVREVARIFGLENA